MTTWVTEEIRTEDAPLPKYSFSQGVRRGPLLQVAGQNPVNPDTGEMVPNDVGAQTTQALRNMLMVLRAGGADLGDVMLIRVYLTQRDHFVEMNEAYGAFVAEHIGDGVLPGRVTVFTGLAREEMLIEVDALAAIDPNKAD